MNDNDTSRFIHQWFIDKPMYDYMLVWTLAGKQKLSYWYQNHNDIPDAVALMPTRNIFIGMGTADTDLGEINRAKEPQIVGIPGLWADIDYGNEGHTKSNNPPTEDDAYSLIHEMPKNPTMIVSSGHGLHAYWQFDDWFSIAFESDRIRAKTLETRWLALLGAKAQAHKWQVDSVNDLSRVLRIPGSFNHKTADKRRCEIIIINADDRYSINCLEQSIPTTITTTIKPIRSTRNTVTPESHNITIPDITPTLDHDRMARLMENRKFSQTLEHNRTDKAFIDQSASGYEMSLVNFALMDGWSNQEAVNLCIYFRKKHKLALDSHDVGYYVRTLHNVHEDIADKAARDNEAIKIKELAKNSRFTQMDDTKRDQVITDLRAVLQIPLTRVVVVNADPHLWTLETEIGNVDLGEIPNMTSFTKCSNHILDAIGIHLPMNIKGKMWDESITQLLSDVRVEIEMEDATSVGAMRSWLREYWQQKAQDDDNLALVFEDETPVITEDGVYMTISNFLKWLYLMIPEKPSRPQVCTWIRNCGGCKMSIHHPTNNARKKRVWLVPRHDDSEF